MFVFKYLPFYNGLIDILAMTIFIALPTQTRTTILIYQIWQ